MISEVEVPCCLNSRPHTGAFEWFVNLHGRLALPSSEASEFPVDDRATVPDGGVSVTGSAVPTPTPMHTAPAAIAATSGPHTHRLICFDGFVLVPGGMVMGAVLTVGCVD